MPANYFFVDQGTGNINFQGDGTLQGWTIQNQFHSQEYTPMHKLPGNLFGIKANNQAFVLQTPQNYSQANQSKPVGEESHVTPYQVRRMQQMPGIRSLKAKCQYPIATVDYDIAGFPVDVQLRMMTPLVPGNARDSSFPVAIFDFSVTNPGTEAVEVSLMQSTLNFIGWDGISNCCGGIAPYWCNNVNSPVDDDTYSGWKMTRVGDLDERRDRKSVV